MVEKELKLLAIYDSPGWAYHRIALQIEKLTDEYEVELVGYHQIYSKWEKFEADVVIMIPYQAIVMREQGLVPASAKLIVCQYDDNVWRSEPDQKLLLQKAMSQADMALFANVRLENRIAADLGVPLPAMTGLCEDGVDTEFFDYWYHVDWEAQPLKVGWCGNSSGQFHGGDNKGLVIIKEALSDLPGVELSVIDRDAHWRSPIEMMSWYRDIHLILCASQKEGTPNPVLEAASTGRGFVSCLPVGIIPDLLSRAEKATPGFRVGTKPGIVIGDRSSEALRSQIEVLAKGRDLVREMGKAAAQEVRTHWKWADKVEQFRNAIHRVTGRSSPIEIRSSLTTLPATLPEKRPSVDPKIIGVFGASYCGGSLVEYILDAIPGFVSVGKPWKNDVCLFCGQNCSVLSADFQNSLRVYLRNNPLLFHQGLKTKFPGFHGICLGGMNPDLCREIGNPDVAVVVVGHPMVSAENFKLYDGQDIVSHLYTWYTFYRNYLLRYLFDEKIPAVIVNIENLFTKESLYSEIKAICEAVTEKPFESTANLLWDTEWFKPEGHHRIGNTPEGELCGGNDADISNLKAKHLWRYLRALALNPTARIVPPFSNVIQDDDTDETANILEKPRPKFADQLHSGLIEIVDSGADLTRELTVFVPTVHGPDLENCLAALKKQDCKFTGPALIENISPMDKAFQCMNDWCLTPYFVQIDEDMILDKPYALRRLHGAAVRAGERYPIVCFPLFDTLFERIILGVKIYRHETIRRYPFLSSGSCEMDQAERLAADGYQILIDWRDSGKANHDFVDSLEHEKVLGLHGQIWMPHTIYETVLNRFLKWRRFGYVWLEEYPRRFLDQLIREPSDRSLWAFLGMAAGLSSDMGHLDSEKDFRKYNDIPGWKQFQRFFGEKASTNLARWGEEKTGEVFLCGDMVTYKKAAEFLQDCRTIEDWGCGRGGFKSIVQKISTIVYKGIDGSQSPNVDLVVDLCGYTGDAEGILLRHVLEHNYGWQRILENAIRSFSRKLCIVLFTPFSAQTRELYYHKGLGVPDISFSKEELIRIFEGHQMAWELEEGIPTDSSYKQEHIFRLTWKRGEL